MVSFRPILSHEFSGFVDYFIPDYAAEIASNYQLEPQTALQQASQEVRASFPDNEKTAGQVLLCILHMHPSGEKHIGYLWYKPDVRTKSVFINDFYLFPDVREKGLGKQAMKRLEQRLISEGYTQIKLRVAADNPRARHVYETSGFGITGINMSKVLVDE